jgi:hypothetical protein
MKKTAELSLIDGHFTVKDASEVLNRLFQDKIKFHELKNFSAMERTGKKDLTSLNRIKQLKENCTQIVKMINEHENQDGQFVIHSTVNVSFLSKTTI